MMRWVPLVLLVGCTSEVPSLVVERQPSTLAQATDSGWTHGSAILTGAPGIFTFPQPVSLRITAVDDFRAEMPKQIAISQTTVAPYGSGELAVTVEPTCDAMTCTAELSMTAAGSGLVAINAKASDDVRACFYYAVVDTSTDTMALQAQLEQSQEDCRFAKN